MAGRGNGDGAGVDEHEWGVPSGERYGHGVRAAVAPVVTGLAATVALVALASCGEPDDFEWPDDPSPQPPRLAPGAQAEADEVTAVVDGFRAVDTAVQAAPGPSHQVREQYLDYVADPLLTYLLIDIEVMHRRGMARDGEPAWEPTVVEVRWDDEPPTATIEDCLDATGWSLVDADTGDPVEPEGLSSAFPTRRHLVTFEATQYDGQWLLREAEVEEGAQC